MVHVELAYNLVNHWYKQNNVSVIGKVFYNNNWITQQAFASLFQEVESEADFVQLLHKIDGHFAVLIENKNQFYAATDRMRTFPILLSKTASTLFVSDNISNVKGTLNTNVANDFLKVYCTLENTTLLNEWVQLQGGDYAVIQKESVDYEIKKYYRHYSSNKQINAEQLFKIAEQKLIDITLQYAANRIILIPLSGGYDARYLLALLLQRGFKNIECYTYGKKDSYEVETAKKICDALQVKWHFIEYTNDLLHLFFSKTWEEYSNINHHFTSLPHEQDFFALYYLKHHQLLPKNAVVMNGFCQDIHAGSFIEPTQYFNLRKFIQNKYGIHPALANYDNSWEGYREWLINNRLSKFIINSIRVYEFFGLDFYLPFWQTEWVNFWYSLPLEQLQQQQFYKKHIFKEHFEPLHIGFIKPDDTINTRVLALKSIGKSILPKSLIRLVQARQQDDVLKDINNTLHLYHELYQRLENPKPYKDFKINTIHAFYFLQKIKKTLNFIP